MTVWLGHGNPLHLAYSAQYFKSSARNSLGCTALETVKQRGSKSTVSLISHKSHNNYVHNPKSKL